MIVHVCVCLENSTHSVTCDLVFGDYMHLKVTNAMY